MVGSSFGRTIGAVSSAINSVPAGKEISGSENLEDGSGSSGGEDGCDRVAKSKAADKTRSAIAQRGGGADSLDTALLVHGFPGVLHLRNPALQGKAFSVRKKHAIELQLDPGRFMDNPDPHFATDTTEPSTVVPRGSSISPLSVTGAIKTPEILDPFFVAYELIGSFRRISNLVPVETGSAKACSPASASTAKQHSISRILPRFDLPAKRAAQAEKPDSRPSLELLMDKVLTSGSPQSIGSGCADRVTPPSLPGGHTSA